MNYKTKNYTQKLKKKKQGSCEKYTLKAQILIAQVSAKVIKATQEVYSNCYGSPQNTIFWKYSKL